MASTPRPPKRSTSSLVAAQLNNIYTDSGGVTAVAWDMVRYVDEDGEYTYTVNTAIEYVVIHLMRADGSLKFRGAKNVLPVVQSLVAFREPQPKAKAKKAACPPCLGTVAGLLSEQFELDEDNDDVTFDLRQTDDKQHYTSTDSPERIAAEMSRLYDDARGIPKADLVEAIRRLVKPREVRAKRPAPQAKFPGPAVMSRVNSALHRLIGNDDHEYRVHELVKDGTVGHKIYGTYSSLDKLVEAVRIGSSHLRALPSYMVNNAIAHLVTFMSQEQRERAEEDEQALAAARAKREHLELCSRLSVNAADHISVSASEGGHYLVHTSGSVDETAKVGRDSLIGPLVVIDKHAVVGDEVSFGQNANVRAFAKVSSACLIGANAVVFEHAFVGDNTTLGANARVRRRGFVGNNVSIGQDSTVSNIGEQCLIGARCNIDDDSHVQHRVVIEDGCDVDNSLVKANAKLLLGTRLQNEQIHDYAVIDPKAWRLSIGPVGSRHDFFTVVEQVEATFVAHKWYVGCQTSPYTTQQLVEAVTEEHRGHANTHFADYKAVINYVCKMRRKFYLKQDGEHVVEVPDWKAAKKAKDEL